MDASWLDTAATELDIIEGPVEGTVEPSPLLGNLFEPPSVSPVLPMEQEQMSRDSRLASPAPLEMHRFAVMMSQMMGEMKVIGNRRDVIEDGLKA